MKKFILSVVTCLVFCCTFLLNGFYVHAADPYYVNYAEPSVGENSGYIILEFASGKVGTFFWSAYSQSDYLNDVEAVDTGCSIVIDDQKVIFTILTDSNIDADVQNVTTQYTISNYTSAGTYGVIRSGSVVDSNPSYTYNTSGTIVGFTYKGNVSLVTNQLDGNNSKPIVVFGDNIIGQYIHDLYQLISSDNELLEEYLPILEEISTLEQGCKEQLELLVTTTDDILTQIRQDSNLLNTYLPKLNKIEFGITQLYQLMQDVTDYIIEYYPEFQFQLEEIRYTLYDIEEALFSQGSIEQDAMNDFRDDSSDQSTTINGLNNQSFVPKPNVDDMSSTVDSNLNVDIDANYGLLLSAFTSNNRILTMMLLVASISLISYVFFGKR